MQHANITALCLIEWELLPVEVLHCGKLGIGIFNLLVPVTLTLDQMTFIYELNPYSMEIYCMCRYELPTSKLSSDRHTDSDMSKIIYHAALCVVNKTIFKVTTKTT